MPWDSVRLRVAEVRDDGSLGDARTVAGGPGISVTQAAWSPTGVLHAVSDETGWWNLYAFDGPDGIAGAARNLAPMDAELGDPAWVFGRSSYAFGPDGSILAVARRDGADRLLRIDADGSVTPLETRSPSSRGCGWPATRRWRSWPVPTTGASSCAWTRRRPSLPGSWRAR